jgi:uncharacterized protein (DUF488 family)
MTAPAARGNPAVFTVGHSVRPLAQFLELLRGHRVQLLADVRTVPRSRRHPHFSRDALEHSLPAAGIGYRHFPDLGGLRKPRRDSPNAGWKHPSFRGYADHMGTEAFAASLDEVLALAREQTVALMCAEAKWWQCHRQLIADALVARGIEVRHIMSPRDAPAHELTAFARVTAGRVTYPALL